MRPDSTLLFYNHRQNCWDTLRRVVYRRPPLPPYNVESSIFLQSLLIDPNIAWWGLSEANEEKWRIQNFTGGVGALGKQTYSNCHKSFDDDFIK